jgi:hypothetical protein
MTVYGVFPESLKKYTDQVFDVRVFLGASMSRVAASCA